MDRRNVKVSVVMTAYNSEKYIAETIKSILEQTYVDYELIIVDDGSTDSTVDIINSFSDNRITLIVIIRIVEFALVRIGVLRRLLVSILHGLIRMISAMLIE